MKPALNERCIEKVHNDWGVGMRRCANPAKEEIDGRPLCGVHVYVIRKRAERERAQKERYMASQANKEIAKEFAHALARWQIEAMPHYKMNVTGSELGTYTGGIILSADDTRRVLSLLNSPDRAE